MSIESIRLWHKRARPEPTAFDFQTQLSCHIEEFVEMLDVLEFGETWNTLRRELIRLQGAVRAGKDRAVIQDREALLDSLVDQIVTAVGVAHCAGMNPVRAAQIVNLSNWSKFDDDGQPIRDEHGKIKKGPNYKAPDLTGLY